MPCSICGQKMHNARRCPDKPKKPPSAKRSEQSRINGRKSNKKPEHKVFELFANLDAPPENPLELTRWLNKIGAKLLHLTLQGDGSMTLNSEYKKLSDAMMRNFPRDVAYEAEKRLQSDTLKRKHKRGGAALDSPVKSGGPLR